VPPVHAITVLDSFWEKPLGPLLVWQWLGGLGVLVGATLVAVLLRMLLLRVGLKLATSTTTRWDDALLAGWRGPITALLWALFFNLGMSALALPGPWLDGVKAVAHSVTIFSVAWFARRSLAIVVGAFELRESGDGRYRSLRTQFEMTRRVVDIGIGLVAAAVFLLQFEVVRNVGVSLLASAGVAGVVLGFAAQKSISSLFAGIQLSITQPIRLGDSVVVEGKFGMVEEIRLTYVVVRTWDLKRLVVPITFFLEKPFENWTLASTQLLGEIFLKVDFLADVDAFRAELDRVLTDPAAKALWDGKTRVVHVTEADERTATLRILVSAADPSLAFDLRCLVRERVLAFLRRHPEWLPRVRSLAAEASLEPTVQGPQPDQDRGARVEAE
jgi:small-conductance mechanosensitive channel